MEIGDRIQLLADQAGGIAALSRYCGLSRTAVQGFVTRANPPSRRTLIAICEGVGCTLDWLEEGQGPVPKIQIENLRWKTPVSEWPPTGLRKMGREAHPSPRAEALLLVSQRVQEALAQAAPGAIEVALPSQFVAAYAAGIAIPGPAHRSAIAAAARVSEAFLLGDEK